MDLCGISNNLQRSASVCPAGDGGILISVRAFVRGSGCSGRGSKCCCESRSQRPWAQWCCQLPVLPTPRTGGCLLCSCRVLGAFGHGHGASAGVSASGSRGGLRPAPGACSSQQGKGLCHCQCMEHRAGWRRQLWGRTKLPRPPSRQRLRSRDVPSSKAGQCSVASR